MKIKLFKQSEGYCGPAALRMVFSAYGIDKSEEELAKLTKASRKTGCKEENMIKVAKKFGLKGYIKQKSTIKELKHLLKKKIPVIVDWFSPEEGGHYSVVVGFEGDKIIIADSHFGEIKKHNIDWFKERWFDVVRDKLYLREIIVIYK